MSQITNLDITSANASAVLIVEGLFPSGIELQMFGTDQAISMEAIDVAETRKGVDGKLVAGYVPAIYPVTVTLEAASPSHSNLATVWEAMAANRRVYACTLVCTVPSINTVFTWSTGVMKNGAPFPALEKVLGATTWAFDFQDFERSQM